MKRRLLLLALLLAGCNSPADATHNGPITRFSDPDVRVTCWVVYSAAISCLPDSQVVPR